MKWFKILVIAILATGTLQAEKVKTFDLNDQILDASGKKVEKFKVNNIIISTNLALAQNQDYYSANKNGYFGIEFDKLENNFILNFAIGHYNIITKQIWRFIDDLGESQFIYIKYSPASSMTYFYINGKEFKTRNYGYTKITVKNNKLTLYSNNEKLGTFNISNLRGVKAVDFEDIGNVSDFIIVKEK